MSKLNEEQLAIARQLNLVREALAENARNGENGFSPDGWNNFFPEDSPENVTDAYGLYLDIIRAVKPTHATPCRTESAAYKFADFWLQQYTTPSLAKASQ